MTEGYAAPASYGSCGTCNDGWAEDGYGAYIACQLCVSATTPVPYGYESNGYNREGYDPARANEY
jgi:hypothetical protein